MTNYDEFKAIADDIAEMYANGYAEYAEYFSETFSGIGELSAVTRMSDKLYTLRHIDVNGPWYTDVLKEIAIDAMLTIGEVCVCENDKVRTKAITFEIGSRYLCTKPLSNTDGASFFVPNKIYVYKGYGEFCSTEDTSRVLSIDLVEADKYLQKIIEKK